MVNTDMHVVTPLLTHEKESCSPFLVDGNMINFEASLSWAWIPNPIYYRKTPTYIFTLMLVAKLPLEQSPCDIFPPPLHCMNEKKKKKKSKQQWGHGTKAQSEGSQIRTTASSYTIHRQAEVKACDIKILGFENPIIKGLKERDKFPHWIIYNLSI